MQRNYWPNTFKQYLLKYFIFDSHGKQYRFRKLDDAIQLRKENNLPV